MGTLTEKLLTYALGRGLESYDMPAVRAILPQRAARRLPVVGAIVGIVDSVPFRMRVIPSGAGTIEARSGGPAAMIITKKHLSRRTLLRGLGATLALPLLDGMVPALSALAKTSAAPRGAWRSSTRPTA